jgi:superfamily II DNA or RNA helicase
MIKVELGNVYSTVLSFDEWAEEKALKKALTFVVPGFMFMTSYKKGVWDGMYSFYNQYSRKFLSGLLAILPSRLKERLMLVDKRTKPFGEVLPNGTLLGISLRDYQQEAVEAALLKERCIISAVTNAGKTEIAAGIMARMPCNTLWLTHRENLLYQTKERLESRLGEKVGILHQTTFSPQRITVAMVPTLHRRLTSKRKPVKNQMKGFVSTIGMMFLDECHHGSSTTWKTIAKNCDAFYRFGLSATPLLREEIENIWLIGLTGEQIETVTNKELIERGISARPKIFVLHNYISVTGTYQYVYQKGVEENLARNCAIGLFARESNKRGEPCLTLVNTIRHGECVMKRMPAGTVFLAGKDDVGMRINTLKQLASGSIPGIVATPIFDEGVDAPAIKVLILAAAGKSQIRLLQRLGRGMRQKTEGENKLTVYDFEDRGNKYLEHHGACRRRVYLEEGFDVAYISVKEKGK